MTNTAISTAISTGRVAARDKQLRMIAATADHGQNIIPYRQSVDPLVIDSLLDRLLKTLRQATRWSQPQYMVTANTLSKRSRDFRWDHLDHPLTCLRAYMVILSMYSYAKYGANSNQTIYLASTDKDLRVSLHPAFLRATLQVMGVPDEDITRDIPKAEWLYIPEIPEDPSNLPWSSSQPDSQFEPTPSSVLSSVSGLGRKTKLVSPDEYSGEYCLDDEDYSGN